MNVSCSLIVTLYVRSVSAVQYRGTIKSLIIIAVFVLNSNSLTAALELFSTLECQVPIDI